MSEEEREEKKSKRDPNANAISAWSMAKEESQRISHLFEAIDKAVMKAHSGETAMIGAYFGGLKAAYAAASTFIRREADIQIKRSFVEVRSEMARAQRATLESQLPDYSRALDKLDFIYAEITASFQKAGLRFGLKAKPKPFRIKGVI